MGSLSLRYKVCVFSCGIVLTVWLFAEFVYFPWQQRMAGVAERLQLELAMVKNAQEFVVSQPEPSRYLQQLDRKLDLLEQILPSTDRTGRFLPHGEMAAKSSGIQLLSVKPGEVVHKNGYQELSLQLIVQGNFFQTMQFIKTLETGPHFSNVSHIVLQAKPATLESKITIMLYSCEAAQIP